MRFPTIVRRGLALSTIAFLAACGEKEDEGGLTGVELNQTLPTTEIQSTGQAVAAITADPALAEFARMGSSFSATEASLAALVRGPAAAIKAAQAQFGLRPEAGDFQQSIVIPSEYRGKAYRYSANTGWTADPSVAGPSNGVRIYIHPLSSSGSPSANAVGYVEFRDSSTATSDVVNARIFNLQGTALANLRQTVTESSNGAQSEVAIVGTLGASNQIQLADTLRETYTTNDYAGALRIRTTIPGQSLSLLLSSDAPSALQRSQNALRITLGQRTVRIEGSSAAEEGALSNGPDSLSVYLNDQLVGRSVVQAGQHQANPFTGMTAANGQPASQETIAWVTAIVGLVDNVPMGLFVSTMLSFLLFAVMTDL